MARSFNSFWAFGFILLVALAAGMQAAQPTADLRLKLLAGQRANFNWTSEGDQTVTLGTSPTPVQSTKSATTLGLAMRVDKADASGASVELQIKTIKTTMTMKDGPASYDSTAPVTADKPNMVAAAFEPLVGARMLLKLDPNGKILDITGIENLPRGPGEAGQMRWRWLEKQLLTARFAPIFSSSGSTSDSVAAGSTWTVVETFPLSGYGSIAVTLVHTLASIDDTDATIAVKGNAETELNAGPDAAKIKSQSGEIERTVIWDGKAGLLRKVEGRQKLAIEIQNQAAALTICATSKTTIERVE